MADELMRKAFEWLDCPTYETVAFAQPPPLTEATVAIVTSAGLAHRGELWTDQDPGFRVFDWDDADLILAHNSTNFDRVGFSADRNVVYPIDRLAEMAREGAIGGLSRRHLSFMGSLANLSTLQLDTGPAAAKLLAEDGVGVVLLTPV
jgi:D-proline reductase (dithiol) PrdB